MQAWREGPRWPRDRYGRRLARITVDGADLGALLIAEGHAVAWTGRKARWCESAP